MKNSDKILNFLQTETEKIGTDSFINLKSIFNQLQIRGEDFTLLLVNLEDDGYIKKKIKTDESPFQIVYTVVKYIKKFYYFYVLKNDGYVWDFEAKLTQQGRDYKIIE